MSLPRMPIVACTANYLNAQTSGKILENCVNDCDMDDCIVSQSLWHVCGHGGVGYCLHNNTQLACDSRQCHACLCIDGPASLLPAIPSGIMCLNLPTSLEQGKPLSVDLLAGLLQKHLPDFNLRAPVPAALGKTSAALKLHDEARRLLMQVCNQISVLLREWLCRCDVVEPS